ncbi:hypothetical protein HK102_004361 [Quaeritorhiza haematococci]|nr:hypothetical protein HK102_004361 [Quaeritorhiza haematococci]
MLMGWEVSRYRNLEPVGDAFFERLNLSHSEIDDLVEALELDMVRGLDGGYTLQTRGLFKKQPPQFAESDTDENLAEKRQALLAMLREYEHQRDALLDMLKKVAKRLRFDRDEAEQRRVEPASPARSTSEAALLPIEEEENPMTSVLGFDPELEAPLFVSWLTLSGLATEGQPEDIVPAAQNLLKNAATAHWMGISSRSTFQTYSIASALPWYGIWQTSVVGIMAAALFQTNDTGALCDPNQLQKWWSGHSPTLALLAGISLVYRVIMASVWGAAIDFIQSSMKSNEQKGIREAMIIFDPAMTKHHQRRQQLRALSNPATRQESSKVEIAVAGPNPSTPSGSTPPSSSASKAPASPASTPTRQPFAAKDLVKSLIWFRNCTQPSAWVLIFGVSMLAFVGVVLGVLTIWTMVVVIRTTAGSIGLGRDFWAVLHTLLAITGAVARWYVITHPFAGSPHPVLKTKKLLRQAQTGIKSSSLKKHIVKMTWIISLLVLVLALVFVPVYECVAKWISRELWITLVNRTLSALKGLL